MKIGTWVGILLTKYRLLLVIFLCQAFLVCVISLVLSQYMHTSHKQLHVPRHLNHVEAHRAKHKIKFTRHAADLQVKVLLENRTLCKGFDMVDVLFMVNTAPRHTFQRKVIRSTFANSTFYKNFVVKVIFLLGLAKTNMHIKREHHKYGDIIQGNFTDAYKNLTYKGIMGFKWISENCRNVKYVFKIDDDTYVDTFNFINLFYYQKYPDVIMCHVFHSNSLPVDRTGTWGLSRYILRHYARYPWTLCSGYAVVISGSLVPKIYKTSHIMQYLWIDDVLIFGILPALIESVKRIDFVDKIYSTVRNKVAIECFRHTNCTLVVGQASPKTIIRIWNARYNSYMSGKTVTIEL